MVSQSQIEWTDVTWNVVTCCSRESASCENFYAERLASTRLKDHPLRQGLTDRHGRWTGEVRFNAAWLGQPLRWSRPRMVFVAGHGDLFHESVPEEWIDRVFAVMAMASYHTFQILTKRPERMRDYLVRLDSDEAIERVANQAVEIADNPCAQVPFFFKQWGGLGSKSGGRELDGRAWDEVPATRRPPGG